MFISTRSRIASMFAAAIGGSLLLVASPAEAFASDLGSPPPSHNPETSTVSESSPAEIILPEQTTSDPSTVTDTDALDARTLADRSALEAKAAADVKAAA